MKVEKFSIGFGPTLFGFRRGETEYVLAAIPLGGFVKMLGEGPEDEASKSTDPRAYPNKSVWARMAIISAGVIMNVILGLACFVYAYGQGMDEIPAKVGAVDRRLAGLQGGHAARRRDRRDRRPPRHQLRPPDAQGPAQRPGQVLHFDSKRPGQEGLIPVDIEPRREASSRDAEHRHLPSESLEPRRPSCAPAGMVDPPAKSGARAPQAGGHARRHPGRPAAATAPSSR